MYIYFKLLVLLYADDTVIMSEASNGLQSALNVYKDYCKQWKLTVNINKSKVVIFPKVGKQIIIYLFIFFFFFLCLMIKLWI